MAFKARKIDYAVVGGIAMAFHDLPRFTRDIDILIRPDDLADAEALMTAELGYVRTGPSWMLERARLQLSRFGKADEGDILIVDVLTGYDPHHSQVIEAAIEAAAEGGTVRVAQKSDLVWMKRFRDAPQDQVDIQRLEA